MPIFSRVPVFIIFVQLMTVKANDNVFTELQTNFTKILGNGVTFATDTINNVCQTTINSNVESDQSDNPKLEDLGMILLDDKYNATFKMPELDRMVKLDTFNAAYPTVILTTGWMSMENGSRNNCRETIFNAYFCRGKTNLILFDTADYIQVSYFRSAENTMKLGEFLALFIVVLTKWVSPHQIHVIGHSLGAHISGSAGRNYHQITGEKLPRITGLDAAYPCFNGNNSIPGLSLEDAAFVDAIHTDNGALGQKEPIGHADFYPNGELVFQPGTTDLSKSHNRAHEYYAETVYPGAKETLMATKCNSMKDFNKGKCNDKPIPMGFACPTTARGKYFLKTNKSSPFGTVQIGDCKIN